MEAVYYISTVALLGIVVCIFLGVIRPKLFSSILRKNATRPRIALLGVLLLIVFSSIISATEPASVREARIQEQKAEEKAQQIKLEKAKHLREIEATKKKATKKQIKKTKSITFKKQERKDSNLASGKTELVQKGKKGEKTFTYEVTYVGGKEKSRKLIKEEVTKKPVSQITAIGTYVAPPPSKPAPAVRAPSPSSNPAGASAKCRDGTYSYSQHRQGTCSHHGGVAIWL